MRGRTVNVDPSRHAGDVRGRGHITKREQLGWHEPGIAAEGTGDIHSLAALGEGDACIKEIQDVNVRAALANFQQKQLDQQDMYELLTILETKASEGWEQQEAAGKLIVAGANVAKTRL